MFWIVWFECRNRENNSPYWINTNFTGSGGDFGFHGGIGFEYSMSEYIAAVIKDSCESTHPNWPAGELKRPSALSKQSNLLEDIRLLMVYLGLRIKLRVLARFTLSASRRLFGIPDFCIYAFADGIREFLFGRKRGAESLTNMQKPTFYYSSFSTLNFLGNS